MVESCLGSKAGIYLFDDGRFPNEVHGVQEHASLHTAWSPSIATHADFSHDFVSFTLAETLPSCITKRTVNKPSSPATEYQIHLRPDINPCLPLICNRSSSLRKLNPHNRLINRLRRNRHRLPHISPHPLPKVPKLTLINSDLVRYLPFSSTTGLPFSSLSTSPLPTLTKSYRLSVHARMTLTSRFASS